MRYGRSAKEGQGFRVSRRGLVVLVAAAAVAVALFVARSGVSGHHAKRPTVHTTTRPALDGAPPQIIAGADSDTRLALFETVTGKLLRSLTAWQPGGGVGGPDPAPDGKSIYASRGAGACASQIDRIAVDGSG